MHQHLFRPIHFLVVGGLHIGLVYKRFAPIRLSNRFIYLRLPMSVSARVSQKRMLELRQILSALVVVARSFPDDTAIRDRALPGLWASWFHNNRA